MDISRFKELKSELRALEAKGIDDTDTLTLVLGVDLEELKYLKENEPLIKTEMVNILPKYRKQSLNDLDSSLQELGSVTVTKESLAKSIAELTFMAIESAKRPVNSFVNNDEFSGEDLAEEAVRITIAEKGAKILEIVFGASEETMSFDDFAQSLKD